MKSRDSSIRLKRFDIEEKIRRVEQIKSMIEEFSRMVGDLDHEIAAEHRRTGIEDESHFAYSTFAHAAKQRRENLRASIEGLEHQLDAAQAALDLAEAELSLEVERAERETGAEEEEDVPTHAIG